MSALYFLVQVKLTKYKAFLEMKFLHLKIAVLFLTTGVLKLQSQDTVVSKVNTSGRYNDFAPAIYNDGLVFCSDRPSQFAVSWVDAQGNAPTKIYYSEKIDSKNVTLFSETINSKFNEGPACFSADQRQFIYTGTMTSTDNKPTGKLGLFISNKIGEEWSSPIAFEHNSADYSYSVCHPSLSQDGNKLYFSSDMPGGYGARDIYYSEKIEGKWSKPINLGPSVNSSSNEVFPFITTDNKLYFSGDRGDGLTGLDLFVSTWGDSWKTPERLPAPFNTEKDDFALIMKPDNTSGYFSSGRNGRNDDLFSFSINYPSFDGCQTAELPMFCYYFEETNIVPNDTMPLVFEWEFGDGTKAKGINAEHCYKDFGTYHVALNVYDSLTKVHFAKISEIDVVIAKSAYPFIQSVDSLIEAGSISFSSQGTDIEGFTPEEYFWDSGHGKRSKGYEASFVYSDVGFYTVQLGIIGKNAAGETEKRCATKRIKIGQPETNEIPEVRESVLQETMVYKEEDKLTPAIDSTVYYVEFKQSEAQIPLTDDYFDNIKYEITERYDSEEILYKYSVGETTDMSTLVKVYSDLQSNGYNESIVKEENVQEFTKKTTNTWWYVPDSITASITRHLNKFNEIRFDLGTFTIRKESFDNLNYISEVLNAEKSLRLKINAHTDNVGNEIDNLDLSQKRGDSVIAYLVAKGVDRHRLEAIGHGERLPVATNDNEKGRAENRRVEFEILFPE